MVLKTSGSLKLSEIQGEFGGSNPISMSEYYRNGTYVPDITLNVNIPTGGTINISDFYSSSVSSFIISPSTTNANEGDTVTFTITTTNFTGTLYWSISTGGMTNSDFTSPSNAVTSGGTVSIVGNTGSLSFVINNDLATEGTEYFNLVLKANSSTGPIVAQSSQITVNDTSQGPTYSLSGPSSVTEGNTLTITLTTTNVPDGTILGYTITGITSDDLSSGSLTGSFTVNSNTASVTLGIAQETSSGGYIFFGGDTGKVRRFNLGSSVSGSTFVNETSTLLADQHFLHFKSDGLRMYFSDTSKNIRQYPLSDPYNPNSQSGPSVSKSITISGSLGGACFNTTGSKFYWTDFNSNYIYQHNLSTNWDISTINGSSYTYRWQLTLPSPTQISGIFMSPDGNKVFICSTNYNRVYQYDTYTAFNLGPFAPTIIPGSFLLTNPNPRDITFNDDGNRMYISHSTYIDQYNLSTPWDPTTGVYNSSLNVSAYETVPNGIFVEAQGPEGTETLRLSLNNGADFIDVTIIDVP